MGSASLSCELIFDRWATVISTQKEVVCEIRLNACFIPLLTELIRLRHLKATVFFLAVLTGPALLIFSSDGIAVQAGATQFTRQKLLPFLKSADVDQKDAWTSCNSRIAGKNR
jgi:hypothetical protein